MLSARAIALHSLAPSARPIKLLLQRGKFGAIALQKQTPATELSDKGLLRCRGPDLNRRLSGYEPDELPGCSTPLGLI